MGSTINLDLSQTVIADANGNAQAVVGPATPGETWVINRIIVACNGIAISVAAIYKNLVSTASVIATTISGNEDTDYQENVPLAMGERIICVWAQASVGSNCTVTVQGNKTIAGAIY